MYIPHYYKNENLEEIKAFLQENSFGILINQVDGRPWATHIPLELDKSVEGKDLLVSHLAKANPQAQNLKNGAEVLCIFNGPHAYVSSSWYAEEEVPTWDYIAVHVYGTVTLLTEQETKQSLHKLVAKHEKTSENPISLSDMSPNTLKQVKGVVGFQIEIREIQAAYKLSQTRPEDHPKIIDSLQKRKDSNSNAIAFEIKNLESK